MAMMCPKEFATKPTVYAVGKNYQIVVPVTCETLMWVRIGERCFYDDSNGILRSNCTTHRITVPMEVLDAARAYTVCYRVVNQRKPYFSDVSDVKCYESAFRPIRESGDIHIYHIADAHNMVDEPVRAAGYFGAELDLLVLNGDIPNHSGNIEYFTAIHNIAAQVTNGEIPVVFSRGNHDTRGIYAEKLEEHVPTDCGRSYFTFRLGRLWGLVLDCGEDKPDAHEEYGFTTCFEDFRRRETEFIKDVIRNAKNEYEAAGVEHRIVICHIPFTYTQEPPFDIEQALYTEWATLLRDHVKPQLMMCGHIHECTVSHVGGTLDHKGQPCTVVLASKKNKDAPGVFGGGAFTFSSNRIRIAFNDNVGNVWGEEEIEV